MSDKTNKNRALIGMSELQVAIATGTKKWWLLGLTGSSQLATGWCKSRHMYDVFNSHQLNAPRASGCPAVFTPRQVQIKFVTDWSG